MGYWTPQTAYLVLYLGVISVSCGSYCIIELLYLLKEKTHPGLGNFWIRDFCDLCEGWLAVGGLAGAVGISALFVVIYNPNFFCDYFPNYLNASFWWFILSDVSMVALYKFFMVNRGIEKMYHDSNAVYHELQLPK
jgi:hypothetical protein